MNFKDWTPAMVEAHNARVASCGKALPPEERHAAEARCLVQLSHTIATTIPSTNVKIRPSTDEVKLNKTETAWLRVLRMRYGYVGVQNVTLKLADDTRYTPDNLTIDSQTITFWEVKGFMRDDALVKLKVAARLFPWARFMLVTKSKTGVWEETEVKP